MITVTGIPQLLKPNFFRRVTESGQEKSSTLKAIH